MEVDLLRGQRCARAMLEFWFRGQILIEVGQVVDRSSNQAQTSSLKTKGQEAECKGRIYVSCGRFYSNRKVPLYAVAHILNLAQNT